MRLTTTKPIEATPGDLTRFTFDRVEDALTRPANMREPWLIYAERPGVHLITLTVTPTALAEYVVNVFKGDLKVFTARGNAGISVSGTIPLSMNGGDSVYVAVESPETEEGSERDSFFCTVGFVRL